MNRKTPPDLPPPSQPPLSQRPKTSAPHGEGIPKRSDFPPTVEVSPEAAKRSSEKLNDFVSRALEKAADRVESEEALRDFNAALTESEKWRAFEDAADSRTERARDREILARFEHRVARKNTPVCDTADSDDPMHVVVFSIKEAEWMLDRVELALEFLEDRVEPKDA